ncbi:MAG: TIGR03862 family flavoprotein, partial [Rickettsiales bacterium]|nr:TIGR03862 family flavoprotein [Rickettsiales bacterium]
MAGRGGLNLTHSEPLADFLRRYGAGEAWLAPAIDAFSPADLRAWCEGLGQETFVGSSGRVFPKEMKAATLLRAWLKRLEASGVRYAARHEWRGWEGQSLRFQDSAGAKVLVTPDATLLALGGASWPRLGADGTWQTLLAAQGVAISPLRPANCGFVAGWSEYFRTRFAGQPLKPVAISHGTITRQGEAMVTAQGLEGGVIYALSAPLRDAVEAAGKAEVQLDLRPGMTIAALAEKLGAVRGNQSLGSFLRKAGFSPLATALLHEVTPQVTLAAYTPAQLAGRLKALPVTLTGTAGLSRAISSAGGVKREAVNEDFMLRALPGVFVAGEMLDWEAPTGGYLLQACFSTAVAAAQGVLRWHAAAL